MESDSVLKTVLERPLCSGIVSCDSAATRIWIRIVRCQRPAKVRNIGSQESVLKMPRRE